MSTDYKFKKGDRVKITKPPHPNNWNQDGEMDYLDGSTVVLSDDQTRGLTRWIIDELWYVKEDDMELVSDKDSAAAYRHAMGVVKV